MTEEKQKLLLVDDIPENLELLHRMLKGQYDLIDAINGKEALNLASSQKPDLILLDVMMPEMDGFEVCRLLKMNPSLKDIPVIFLTALNDELSEIIGFEAGAVDYITKPFKPQIVKIRVRTHLELKMFREKYKRISLLDGLTGIPNRRAFNECFNREWGRAQRNKSELSLIMVDIDYFKKYNDTFGHLGGDDCLKNVAEILASSNVRPGDFFARYGGEEFASILPETGPEGAAVTALRMLSDVSSTAIPHPASPVAPVVTISLGVATIIPSPGIFSETLIGMADQMLFKAKEEGRNRIKQFNQDIALASSWN